ncbi:MAG: hypothetical protein ACM30E_11465, partial [Nitrososphaerales archaeon]
ATLIEEQNPARLDNLIFSIAPFAVMGMVRMGRLGRLGNLARLIGRPARRIFGEVEFRGLVQNRPLRELTHHEIYDAFRTTGFTPSNHTIMRLKDIRTANLGVNTLNDVARYMNRGIIQEAGNGLIAIEHQGMQMIVNPETRVLVTFRPQ